MNEATAKAFLKRHQGQRIVNSQGITCQIIGLTPNLQRILTELISANAKFELQPRAAGWLKASSLVFVESELRFGKWLLIDTA